MPYEFLKKPISENRPYASLVKLKAHVIHWTGNKNVGSNAMAHYNYFNTQDVSASAHYFIDDSFVIETIPSNEEAWHAGGTYYTDYAKNMFMYEEEVQPNYFTIGYEMCVNVDGNWDKTVENTTDFVAKKIVETGCYEIVRHYDITGKDCPRMFTKYETTGEQDWINFKNAILNKAAEIKASPAYYETQIIRVKADGVQIVALTGYTKAINYVQNMYGKHIILECKSDGKIWDLGIISAPKPEPVPEPVPTPVPEPKLEPIPEPQIIKNPIMGKAEVSALQMSFFLVQNTSNYKLNCSPLELAQYFIEEGEIEDIRGDIAFAQSIHETGYFNYGGQVLPEQNNFAGIGATNNSPVGKGAWFDTPRIGVRAQIQHLKAYASKESLKQECVDPRFGLVTRGIAPNWEDLNGRWAVPGTTYGQSIIKLFEKIKAVEVPVPQEPEKPIPQPEPEKPVEEPKETPKQEQSTNEEKTVKVTFDINQILSIVGQIIEMIFNKFFKK